MLFDFNNLSFKLLLMLMLFDWNDKFWFFKFVRELEWLIILILLLLILFLILIFIFLSGLVDINIFLLDKDDIICLLLLFWFTLLTLVL